MIFDFSNYIDLPLVWGVLIAVAIFMYVLLDGFDLGVGILFPFAPSDKCRDTMMNSIAPFWDGNETWLILGGGGLLVAFPLAYSILMPAFYIPIIIMLLGLILRGVAFEFRFKSSMQTRWIWDVSFHAGSLIASFCQGMILGSFIQGVSVSGRNFAGGSLDWATGFSIMTGVALVFGYALIGACWVIMKTKDETADWARKVGIYSLIYVCIFMVLVSVSVPFVEEQIAKFWFDYPNIIFLSPIPLITGVMCLMLFKELKNPKSEYKPFLLTISIFSMGYLGLGISVFPWIIPFNYTLWDAAAAGPSLSIMLVGVVPLLPLILGYTAYSYYVFRGKASHERLY
jgi:cytochrome bd ubiquinol oxidase subunit II